MRILVELMYFSASRAAAARKAFVGLPVPARNKNISARPGAARGQGYGQPGRP
jgi:hypothetical protein